MGTVSSGYLDRRRQEQATQGTLAGVVKARDAYIARGLELGGLPAAVVAQMGEAKVVDLSHNRIEELPASICTLASMESFLAHDNLLRELPRAFPQLWSLVNLDLSCNRLTELPDNFPTLPCLRVLRLGQNELSELPENIGNMTTLTSLSGSHNLLKALPHSFTQLTNLTLLDLDYNLIKRLPLNFGRLSRLEMLNVSYNRLRDIPQSAFQNMLQLRFLFLDHNRIDAPLDPLAFHDLTSLVNLSLGSNEIALLPNTFTGDFAVLTVPEGEDIDAIAADADAEGRVRRGGAGGGGAGGAAGGGGGTTLPAIRGAVSAATAAAAAAAAERSRNWAAGLHAGEEREGRTVTLHQVMMANAYTETLDVVNARETARRTRQLEAVLAAQKAKAPGAPTTGAGKGGGAASAAAAAAAEAAAATASAPAPAPALSSAAALAASAVPVEPTIETSPFLGGAGRQWRHLRVLSLANNGLLHIRDSFGYFRTLTTLDLSGNKLTALPETFPASMPILDTLILRDNKIATLPDSIGTMTSLTLLHMQRNELKLIPDSIARVKELQVLDLSGNNELRELPRNLTIGCFRLRRLFLAEMPLLRLPDDLSNLKNLEVVHCSSKQLVVSSEGVRKFLRSGGVKVVVS